MATVDFGTDLAGYPDLDPGANEVTGRAVIVQAIARRFATPRGSLFYDAEYGFDIREYLNDSLSPEDFVTLKREIAKEALKDERITDATTEITYIAQTLSLSVKITLYTGLGPFLLTLNVTQLTTEILFGD